MGLTPDQIDTIMTMNGADITREKAKTGQQTDKEVQRLRESCITLLELLDEGLPEPALIIGMPVGFVNAAESKELLVHSGHPCLALRGRKGGSPLAAAAVNALAVIADRKQ